jgi:hypothetical protein
MGDRRQKARRIVLLVEGKTERGEVRQKTLPAFFHNWLDPQLPEFGKVGVKASKSEGVSNYLDDVAQKAEMLLDQRQADFIFGLVDLYGLPPSRIDLGSYSTVRDKVTAARSYIRSLIPARIQPYFRQHFAVHEVEAWLLAYPEKWPAAVRDQIVKREPEQVNFTEPPAKFLNRILGGRYKKTVGAKNIFPFVDPQTAIDKCPYLRMLAQDMLAVARQLQ